ncbi:hypothetical protein PIB30_061333 [Stylosanthes scabra]|uniref:Disease resistance protein winged helix domain-containing protein n=1 Tax=Stylosanthes scabra TaxID=79078 RepID=A0ABU6XLJ6_9FABA|nr:hypothetical protein [Stylosanthes scabra]
MWICVSDEFDIKKFSLKSIALREWLRQIKRVFSDAEIMLDELECERLRKQVLKSHGTTKDKVGRFFSSSNPLVFPHKMAQKIREIKKRLDRVAAEGDKFGLERIDVDRRVVHRREITYSHVVESDVIGREQDKEKIIKLLLQKNPSDDDDNKKHISDPNHWNWNEDRVRWLELRDLIETMGSNESKILVTTRSSTIASMMGSVPYLVISIWKDCNFKSSILSSLWGAVGLIPSSSKENRTLEDVANQFLLELMSRSFLQDFSDFGTGIHDLVHDLANLASHIHGTSLIPKSATLRTLLFPVNGIGVDDALLNSWCLQTFILGACTELEELPKGIEKLISLRYLEITTKQNALPEKEIANIDSLQRLYLVLP